MIIQPIHHWQLKERQGNTIVDSVSGAKAKLSNTKLHGHGRIGDAIKLDGKVKNTRVVLGEKPGQFGSGDFTIAFGIKVLDTFKQKTLHVIGNRSTSGHGNFFCIRMKTKGQLKVEVDENKKGKNYAALDSARPLADGKWHHIAAVRQGRTLKLYIDGLLTDEAVSRSGIANITTSANLLLGARGLKTPIAQYEDLRIYDSALDDTQVNALVTPIKRPLSDLEIELVGTDNSAIILSDDINDLTRLAPEFKSLRVSTNTRVTLYKGKDFKGTAQRCYADLPQIRHSKLRSSPRSLRIVSAVGEPFTGKWAVKAPNGKYLSLKSSGLTTAPQVSANELFRFATDTQKNRSILVRGDSKEHSLKSGKFSQKIQHAVESAQQAASDARRIANGIQFVVDDSAGRENEFIITNSDNNQWLEMTTDKTLGWTENQDDSAVFVRSVKVAQNENQVGELAAGDVAIYEHVAYHGKTWVFSDSESGRSGVYSRFADFAGLDDKASSIRLGTDTGVTLFKQAGFQVAEDNREEAVEDLVDNAPDLRASQVGNDAVSSIKIFKTISTDQVFTSVTARLSQDYRMVGDKLEEFSAYRTILRCAPGAGKIELSATDLTTVEVEGVTHRIDEQRSITLSPNRLNFIMITSEADGLNTPGLKIRTDKMAFNERIVIFPNREVQQQIAELEDGALWNARDTQGKLIVDRKAHAKAEVASVQNTLSRIMATVTADKTTPSVSSQAAVVTAATIGNPWELKFNSAGKPSRRSSVRAVDSGVRSVASTESPATGRTMTEEVELSQDAFSLLLGQAVQPATAPAQSNAQTGVVSQGELQFVKSLNLGFRIPNPFDVIKDAVKDATSVIVGAIDDVVHVLIKKGGSIIDFVVDSAEKVVQLVEAIAEKVVSSVKQFIEFLQFLFDWEDILATQRAMVASINSAFDSASVLVSSAKTQVAEFIGGLKDGLNEGADSLAKSLGVDPDEANNRSKMELPESAEWFLNKVLGGSKGSGRKTTPQTTSAGSTGTSGDSFQLALQHLLDGLKDLGGIGVEIFDGLFGTVETLIANPLRPELALVELLDTFRDVGIKILDLGENLIFAFLETVVGVIKLFRELLNAEIRIPFISELFKHVGAGKLTLLNLASVLLAIPVTVVSKLLFGRAPFQAVSQPEFPEETVLSVRSNLVGNSQLFAAGDEPKIDFGDTRRKISTFGSLALVSDTINGIITTGLEIPSENSDGEGNFILEVTSLLLSGFSWLSSFPASKVEPGGYPYNIAHPDHRVSKRDDEQEYWERVMWGWRTGVLGLDILVMIASLKLEALESQRMRRNNVVTAGLATALAAVDLGITSRYLATTKGDDNRGILISNEVVSIMPTLLCGLRFSDDFVALAARFTLNGTAASMPFLLGMQLLSDDLKELEEKQSDSTESTQRDDLAVPVPV